MAVKTATIMVRVEPEVKEQAEVVLERLGLSVSTVINTLYRQIIMQQRLPFSLEIPQSKDMSADSISEFKKIKSVKR